MTKSQPHRYYLVSSVDLIIIILLSPFNTFTSNDGKVTTLSYSPEWSYWPYNRFNCSFSFAPVFQWCCSTPQGSPGVGRNTFLSSPHLCFITVFICDLFVSCDDPLMS